GFRTCGPPSLGQVHTPARGLEDTSNHILGLNKWLSGWDCGSIIFILLFLLLTPWFQIWDKILFAGIATLVCFYFGYYFQDLVFGPRFLFIAAPVLLLFVARSISPEEPTSLPNWQPYALSLLVISVLIY